MCSGKGGKLTLQTPWLLVFWVSILDKELAAVATQLPDIRWLGRQVLMWCGKPEED